MNEKKVSVKHECLKRLPIVRTFLNEGRDGFQKIRFMNTKTEPKTVTNTVGTFLKENSNGLQKIRIMTAKRNRKGYQYVGTFLAENGDGLRKISIITTQTKPKKVTNMVGTFLDKDRNGLCNYSSTL